MHLSCNCVQLVQDELHDYASISHVYLDKHTHTHTYIYIYIHIHAHRFQHINCDYTAGTGVEENMCTACFSSILCSWRGFIMPERPESRGVLSMGMEDKAFSPFQRHRRSQQSTKLGAPNHGHLGVRPSWFHAASRSQGSVLTHSHMRATGEACASPECPGGGGSRRQESSLPGCQRAGR